MDIFDPRKLRDEQPDQAAIDLRHDEARRHGQRVRIIAGSVEFHNRLGTVIMVTPKRVTVHVDDTTVTVDPSHLEPVFCARCDHPRLIHRFSITGHACINTCPCPNFKDPLPSIMGPDDMSDDRPDAPEHIWVGRPQGGLTYVYRTKGGPTGGAVRYVNGDVHDRKLAESDKNRRAAEQVLAEERAQKTALREEYDSACAQIVSQSREIVETHDEVQRLRQIPETAHEHYGTLQETLRCIRAWEPEVRLLGNVKAGDMASAIHHLLEHIGVLEAEKARPTSQPVFFGESFEVARDGERLRGHLEAVRRSMLANRAWRTAERIATDAGLDLRSDVKRRIRDLRQTRNGGHLVDRRRTDKPGVWEYRIRP